MSNFDIYFKKVIQYDYRGHELTFRVSQPLFSSREIDHGTQRLLRTFMFGKVDNYNKVLDLGCGYGPIGIALKSFNPTSTVHMVDIDALALEYSRQNASINNFNDIKTYASLGYDDIIDTDFDLIASNIPAKIGEKALEHILKDARFYLKPRGRVAVVVIDAIVEYVKNALFTDPNIKILLHKAWPGHTVFHYEFISENKSKTNKLNESSFDRGVFDREKNIFSIDNLNFPMQTVYGLSEFDTLSYETKLLIDNLRGLRNSSLGTVVVFNPGQGYAPVVLSLYAKINKLILVDRNLLALRVSRRNLMSNSYSKENISLLHQIDLSNLTDHTNVDYIIGILDEEDGPTIHAAFIEQAASQLSEKGIIIVSSTSTIITRVEKFIRSKKTLEISERKRSKGKSLLILKKKNTWNSF